MRKTILLLLGVLMALPAFARDFEYEYEGQTLTYTVISEVNKTVMTKEGGFYIINNNFYYYPGNEVSGDLIIPEIAKDGEVEYTVTKIGEYAFSRCSRLTSVTIGNSVKSIGSLAFLECSGLTSVTIGNSVESIGKSAFSGCSGLTSVTIPDSVTLIDYRAFYGCTGLTSVTIPNSVKSIGDYAFDGCGGLIKSAYPNNLNNPFSYGFAVAYNPEGAIIEDGFIYGPEKKEIIFAPLTLKGNFTIPNSVTSIGNDAFYNCSGLTSVTIGKSVESIGDYAFDGCSGLTEVIALSEKPVAIVSNSFDGVYNRALLKLSENADVYGYLFTAWGFFENIKKYGTDNSITYNDGVLRYGLLQAANSDENNTAVVISGDYSGDISVPERFAYESESGETERYYVTGIGYNAFANSNISKIEFNSRIDLKTIGEKAFRNCNYLKEISIPKTVETIGNDAFYGCIGLTSVTIPNSVTSIGANAFDDCSGLTKAEFGSIEQLCSIDFGNGSANPLCYAHNLYINGEEIKELVIPESVTSIGNYAFDGCSGLASVTIPNSVKSIGEDAFAWCTGLTSVIIGNSVESIGESAFYGCSGLTSVTIPNSVESIGASAFLGCSGLTSVTIPNSVTSIGNSAFLGCSGVTFIKLGSGVESIEESVFHECVSLSELNIADGDTPISLSGDWLSRISKLYMGREIIIK